MGVGCSMPTLSCGVAWPTADSDKRPSAECVTCAVPYTPTCLEIIYFKNDSDDGGEVLSFWAIDQRPAGSR